VWKKWFSVYKSSNIFETWQDKTKVTIEEQYEVPYALSIVVKINDLGALKGFKTCTIFLSLDNVSFSVRSYGVQIINK